MIARSKNIYTHYTNDKSD